MNFSSLLIVFLAASGAGGLGSLATANKDKAGKAKASESEEVSLHRERQHQCDSMAPFEGSFLYQSGCGENPFEVSITCKNKGQKEERSSGLMCSFFEKTVNDDSGLCPFSGNFVSKEALNLNTDAKENCVLGPISIYPVPTVDDEGEGCDNNAPKLDVKIIPVSQEELHIFFSKDGGKTYYNQDSPRIALRIPDDDAYGKKSGGSSSKGGKKGKGTNDRRKLVEKTLKQAQRKLFCDFEINGSGELGFTCGSLVRWCAAGLDCHDKKCYKETDELYHSCGDLFFFWCTGSSKVKVHDGRCVSKKHECIEGVCRPPGNDEWDGPFSLC